MKSLYKAWLGSSNLSHSSVKKYLGAINTISIEFNNDIFKIQNLNIFSALRKTILSNTDFIIKNKTGNQMYSSALNHYEEFLEQFSLNDDNLIPEEVNTEILFEGSVKTISINAYERNPIARKICLQKYGHNCCICSFNFKETYGRVGENFIHVHHKIPLNTISESYKVNPLKDLIPVCPNCHAMLHRKIDNKYLTISDLKKILK